MKKISILMFTALIGISYYSNSQANEWNNFMNCFDQNSGNTNNYGVGQCDVNQNDLDDIDNFINDYNVDNQPVEQYVPHHNIVVNNNNQNRKLSYDVSKNQYNNLYNCQNNAQNVNKNDRASTAERYANTFTNTNNYQPLPNNYIQQGNIIVNNDQISNNGRRKYTTDDARQTNNIKILTGIEVQPTKRIPFNNAPKNQVITTPGYNNLIKITPNPVIPTQKVQNNKNQVPEVKLTGEELAQMLSNKAPNIDMIPSVNNNIQVNNNLQVINNILNNNKTPIVNKQIIIPNNARNNVCNDFNQFVTQENNKQQNILYNIKPVVKPNIVPGTTNNQKPGTLNIQRVQIDTNNNKMRNISPNNQIVKNVNNNGMKQQQVQLQVVNTNNSNEILQNNINTYWENGITQDEASLFLESVKNPNAFYNTKLQIYSLIASIAPGFGNPDYIELLLDVLKYNAHNRNQKHIYYYEKPLALTCTFIDYYINNIDLYNINKDKFKLGGIEYSKQALQYNNQDYSIALNYINDCKYYHVISKIVKGINIAEQFQSNINPNQIELKQIPLSNDMNKDWLNSTYQLFNYAIQCSSNSQDRIKNTRFAKFNEYLQTKSKHYDINENIKLIPTLRDFVNENKEQFSSYKINSALEALYAESETNSACCGIMGSIILYRIFPELQTIFSSNQFGIHDSVMDIANNFYFSTDQSLFQQFSRRPTYGQPNALLAITHYDNGRRLFRNTDYLMMVTNGLTMKEVINERKYISRYHEKTANNPIESLELYKLMGVQLCSPNNANYITISGEKLNDAVDSNSTFGKICISNNLQPMQALYKFVSQEDYNKSIKKA